MWLRQFNTGGRSKRIDNQTEFVALAESSTSRRNSSGRADDESYFSAIPAVDVKIAVQREHTTGLVQFRHAYQAGISQRCEDVVVALVQSAYRCKLLGKCHADLNNATFNKCKRFGCVEF